MGQAVIFSSEYLPREKGILINGKNLGIIVIGKIGYSILSSLKSKGSDVSIFAINRVNLVIAYLRWAKVDHKLDKLKNADTLFLATENLSLK